MAGLWAHETLKGMARFLEVGRGGRVLCFGRDGKENTVGVGVGTGHGGSAWRVCLDTAEGHPQEEALTLPLIYTFY